MTDLTRRAFDNAAAARDYMLAGRATITAVSKTTGARFTFKVKHPKDNGRPSAVSHFVSVLNGPDNTTAYTYLGHVMGGDYVHGRKSKVSPDAPSAKAFAWVFGQVVTRNTLPPTLEVWHEGRCGKCGKKLTVPASIERGLGPKCAGRDE